MRIVFGIGFALVATVGCTILAGAGAPKAKTMMEGGAAPGLPVCCHTDPEAGPEGCLCEPASTDIVMVTDTTCSVSTTFDGEVINFTGFVVSTCP